MAEKNDCDRIIAANRAAVEGVQRELRRVVEGQAKLIAWLGEKSDAEAQGLRVTEARCPSSG